MKLNDPSYRVRTSDPNIDEAKAIHRAIAGIPNATTTDATVDQLVGGEIQGVWSPGYDGWCAARFFVEGVPTSA